MKINTKAPFNSINSKEINPEIFRLYDIRGIYPTDLNEEVAYQIGRCFIAFLRQQNRKEKMTIAVGRDIRPSSPLLFKGFSDGVRDEGCNVIDLGMVTTPMLYFTVARFGYAGGIIITASHNPNPYNGIKLTQEKAIPLSGETGIFWIRDHLRSNFFSRGQKQKNRGRISHKKIEKAYIEETLRLVGPRRGEFHGLSVALDAGNGIGGPVALKILKRLGIRIYPLYCRPDGSFPNHVPDPIIKENRKDLTELVKKKKPTFGVLLDGDADRLLLVDEKGNFVPGDLTVALMAEIILRKKPAAKILYDIRSSNIVGEVIIKAGGQPVVYNIGHALIKRKMRQDNIFFAGEYSGHYYLGQGLFFETPFYVLLEILREIKKQRTFLSSLVKPYRKYYHSGEINFETRDKEGKIEKLKSIYGPEGKINEMDGLRVDFSDWWFLVRPSNTEPVVRLVVEAKTRDKMREKRKELTRAIGSPILNKPLIYKTLRKVEKEARLLQKKR